MSPKKTEKMNPAHHQTDSVFFEKMFRFYFQNSNRFCILIKSVLTKYLAKKEPAATQPNPL